MPLIKLSNGQQLNFPDSMSKDEIKDILRKKFPIENKPQEINKDFTNNNKAPWERFLESQGQNPMQDLEPFGGGGEAGRNAALQTAAFAIPQGRIGSALLPTAGKGIQGLANYLGAIGQSAGTSGLLNFGEGKDFSEGAKEGGAIAAALIPGIKGIEKGIQAFKPQKATEQFLDYLSGGNSLQNNVKMLANKIKESGNLAKEKAGELYAPIFKHSSVRDNSIYREVNPSGIHSYLEKPEYKIPKSSSDDLKNLFKNFEKNPTLKNAHDLQSQLYSEANSIIPNTTSDKNLKKNLLKLRQEIKKDMFSFLKEKDPDLLKGYKEATETYKREFGPYLDNSKIRKILQSKDPKLNTVLNIFKNPNESTDKIVRDMGPEGIKRILFSALGHNKETATPEKILSAINSLDKRGFSSYFGEEERKILNSIKGKVRNRNVLQAIGASLAGGQIGKSIGVPGGEAAGAIFGALKGPEIAKKVGVNSPINLSSDDLISAFLKLQRLNSGEK